MRKYIAAFLAAIILVAGSTFLVKSQVTSLSGLAVAQTLTPIQWNNVRDAIAASTLAGGVLSTGVFGFDGSTMSRIGGTIANGLDVDVTRIGGGVTLASDMANPTNAIETGAFLMTFNGIDTNWDRNLSGTTGDSAGGAGMLANTPRVFDETAGFWHRMREAAGTPLADDGVGIAASSLWQRNVIGGTWDQIASVGSAMYVEGHGLGQIRNAMVTTHSVSAAASPVSITVVGSTLTNARLYSIDAYCSAGTSGITVTNEGAAATLWDTPAGEVGTGLFTRDFSVALTNPTVDNDIIVTLASCGGGNTGTLMVRGDLQGQ